MTKQSIAPVDFFVKRIKATKLFGHFTYDLDFACKEEGSANRLALLYGDNGSGKTTLLKLLFHLLSPVDNRGHKTVIAQTKFETFEVQLANGTTILAQRQPNRLGGDVELRIERAGKRIQTLPLKVGKDGSVKMKGTPDEALLMKFLHQLAELKVEILFMRDNRRLTSNLDPEQRAGDAENLVRGEFLVEMTAEHVTRGFQPSRDTSLIQAVENVNTFFRQQALTAASKGETNTNRIYDEIIKHLVLPGKRPHDFSDVKFREYLVKFEALSERNQSFVKVELASPLMAKDMIGSLRKAKADARPALLNVLAPYIDSVQARLEALEGIRRTIYQFTDSLNSFIGNGKQVVFSLGSGLSILGYDGDALSPQALSSGERQLLTMFCHIVCVRGRTAIFIIDEPELSLNVKWQRRLVQSLLDCAEGASVQFIMASHSMELLARHRDHVVQLVDKAKHEHAS
jgi:energy-coupling factor transporter ATP-binding protein EcfA2